MRKHSDTEPLKNRRINFKLSEAERNNVRDLANELKCSDSEAIRRAISKLLGECRRAGSPEN